MSTVATPPLVAGERLDAAGLLAEDLARLVTTVDPGVATPEHAAFVTRLGRA
jgi:hypothetical protein